MKNYLTQSILALGLLLPFTYTAQAADTYTIDKKHSYVMWHISHFGFSNPSGKWLVNGTLVLDKDKPENSKVDVTIETAQISTGIPELDKHMKEALFLNVDKFPTATFVSNKVDVTGSDTAKVQGTFTLRGISKPITLDVKLNKVGISPINNKDTVGFSATTQLKRSDYGITTLLPGLGDDVNISIELEANKPQVEKKEGTQASSNN